MKNIKLILLILLFSITGATCQKQNSKEKIVLITTSLGNIKLKLYNETPLHRDNFLKLIKEGKFTDKIFHRVINQFMIQGGVSSDIGNPANELGYTIPAEFKPNLYHKKGALAAARRPDEVNPQKASTANQFYIVQGQTFTLEQLTAIEQEIDNQNIMMVARKYYQEEKQQNESQGVQYNQEQLAKKVIEKAKAENKNPFKFSPAQIKTYTTIGGTPHLDSNYTVFGEVIEGLNVVDSIAKVKTVPGDRPETDVKFSIRVLE